MVILFQKGSVDTPSNNIKFIHVQKGYPSRHRRHQSSPSWVEISTEPPSEGWAAPQVYGKDPTSFAQQSKIS